LVVPVGVDGEFAEEFAGGGVDDADVGAIYELEDGVRACSAPMPMWWCIWPLSLRLSVPSWSTMSLSTR
jgi:hypothetical protein